jgi:hypothetical protein
MLSSKLFTTWCEAWSKPADMVALFEEAEALLVRRGKGNQRFPIAPAGVFEGALDAAEKYDGRGTSKANVLRSFIDVEDGFMVAKVLRKFYEYRTATLVARESSNILPQSAQSQFFELVADLGRLCAAYAWLARRLTLWRCLAILVVLDVQHIPQVGSLPGGGSVWHSQGPAGYYKFRHSRSGIMVRTDTVGAAPGAVDSIQGRPAWAQRFVAAE